MAPVFIRLDWNPDCSYTGRPPRAPVQASAMNIETYLHDPEREAILGDLAPLLAAPDAACGPDVFDALALRIFRRQFRRCKPFGTLCRFRGVESPDAIEDVARIPLVPTDAFKFHRMACFDAFEGEVRFETSGTTQGTPGRHFMPDSSLYDAAALPRFARALLAAEPGAFRFISLTGSPRAMPHSSLVHMIDAAGRRYGAGGAVDYCFAQDAVEMDALESAIGAAKQAGQPVLLLTTAFALVYCLEILGPLGPGGPKVALPPGSRIMETGGYKGRSRRLERHELYARTAEAFEVRPACIVNEYGMTEMSSQFYDTPSEQCEWGDTSDPDRTGDTGDLKPRIKIPPPWVRSTVLDPTTLRPVGDGETGVLAHIDLANVDSCAFLLTADAAVRRGGGFELIGRLEDAEPRGCSLDYEALGPPSGDAYKVSEPAVTAAPDVRREIEKFSSPLPGMGLGGGSGTSSGEEPEESMKLARCRARAWAALAEGAARRILAGECNWATQRALEPIRADALMELWEEEIGSAGDISSAALPRQVVVIGGGVIPQPNIQALVAALMIGERIFFRPAAGDSELGPRLIREISRIQRESEDGPEKLPSVLDMVSCATWPHDQVDLTRRILGAADALIAFGDEDTLSIFESMTPKHAEHFLYGPRISFAVLDLHGSAASEAIGDSIRDSMQSLAEDIVAYDQLGCLSPAVLYVLGGSRDGFDEAVAGLADSLGAALDGDSLDSSSPPPGAASLIQSLRAVFSMDPEAGRRCVESPGGLGWTILVDAADRRLRTTPGYRTIFVIALETWDDLLGAVGNMNGKLQAMGLGPLGVVCPEPTATALGELGLSRIAALGEMQRPPLDWRHDGNPFFPVRLTKGGRR